jgi:hypothetical protein
LLAASLASASSALLVFPHLIEGLRQSRSFSEKRIFPSSFR